MRNRFLRFSNKQFSAWQAHAESSPPQFDTSAILEIRLKCCLQAIPNWTPVLVIKTRQGRSLHGEGPDSRFLILSHETAIPLHISA